jgi:hypothetical protein
MKSFKPRKQCNDDEQGIVMILALFMGLILLAALTGLMTRQLASRKFGAVKSYQEMAENAAINGFNRILGEANRDDENTYKGYFLTLRNDEESWGWRDPNSAEIRNADGSIAKLDDRFQCLFFAYFNDDCAYECVCRALPTACLLGVMVVALCLDVMSESVVFAGNG